MTVMQASYQDRIIVALDGEPADIFRWSHELAGEARWVKVGMTLFYLSGPAIIEELKSLGYKVFLDLKLHDIPHQVEGAARRLGRLGVDLITVHAAGGRAMMGAALEGARKGAEEAGKTPPKVVAVTVLTSMTNQTLHDIGVSDDTNTQVDRLMRLASEACLDGIVCSPHEAAAARSTLGGGAWIVTPGVRPAGADKGDQSRIMTPADALNVGATHLVIGRPITDSPNPKQAYREIINAIANIP